MTAFIITAIAIFVLSIIMNAINIETDTGYRIFGILFNVGLIIWAVTLL